MNKYNDWENLLSLANEDLKAYGYEILVEESISGCYDCEILKDGVAVENYAQNYYWDELEELVTDAWHYVSNKINR